MDIRCIHVKFHIIEQLDTNETVRFMCFALYTWCIDTLVLLLWQYMPCLCMVIMTSCMKCIQQMLWKMTKLINFTFKPLSFENKNNTYACTLALNIKYIDYVQGTHVWKGKKHSAICLHGRPIDILIVQEHESVHNSTPSSNRLLFVVSK